MYWRSRGSGEPLAASPRGRPATASAPFRRQRTTAAMNTSALKPRQPFLRQVPHGIRCVCPGEASPNHRGADIFPVDATDGDRPAIAVHRHLLTPRRSPRYEPGERAPRGLSSLPTISAALLRLRCIDAVQPDPFAAKPERITIDDTHRGRRCPNHVARRSPNSRGHCQSGQPQDDEGRSPPRPQAFPPSRWRRSSNAALERAQIGVESPPLCSLPLLKRDRH